MKDRIDKIEIELEQIKKDVISITRDISIVQTNHDFLSKTVNKLDDTIEVFRKTIEKLNTDLAVNDIITQSNADENNWMKNNWDKIVFLCISALIMYSLKGGF